MVMQDYINIKRLRKLYKMEKDESGIYKQTRDIQIVAIAKRIFKKDMILVPVNNTNVSE